MLTVFDLAKLLCKQKLTMSSFASPITHFLSLLAIDRVKHVLNPSNNFTPHLAETA